MEKKRCVWLIQQALCGCSDIETHKTKPTLINFVTNALAKANHTGESGGVAGGNFRTHGLLSQPIESQACERLVWKRKVNVFLETYFSGSKYSKIYFACMSWERQ
jgi:hypothetical protein